MKVLCKSALFALLSGALLALASCASLQEDIHTYTEDNVYIFSSIEAYESRFSKIDAKMQMENSLPRDEVYGLLTDLAEYKSSTQVTEPVLMARLRAFEGLLLKMAGRTREAETAYSEAKGLQKGDRYVQLLGCRLAKNTEESLALVESILIFDPKNAVLQLEKGKLYYQQKKYDQAIAVIDNAFIIFDNEGLPQYRDIYNPLRAYIWDLNTVYGSGTSGAALSSTDLQGNLNLETLVSLTLENTSLLENYRSGNQKEKISTFTKSLEEAGYFSSAFDQLDIADSSLYMTGADLMTRKMCARFIWNAYVRRHGNLKMLIRYSEKYSKSGRTQSPVADISIDDADFDAVLGVVESEFMELPDGKNFDPDSPVTKLQFINWIKKADK